MLKYNKKKMHSVLFSIMKEGNVAQGKAVKSICQSKTPLFITGGGGTGKTFFLKKVKEALRNAAIVAPTGVAALNAGGQTIHSFFRLGVKPYLPKVKRGRFVSNNESFFNKEAMNTIESLEYLIIDEVSMVRPDLLDNVADALRKVRKNDDPFGGVKLIMIGDLFQLPPVIKEDYFNEVYDTRYFFGSKSLMTSGMEMISFDKIYRQSDEKFISVLNNVRVGNINNEILDVINSRCVDPEPGREYISIVTTNKSAQEMNNVRFNAIPGNYREYAAEAHGDFPKDAPVEMNLRLKPEARVIITRNGDGYVNGSLGTAMELKDDEIVVKMDKPESEEKKFVKIKRVSFDKIKYVKNGYQLESTVVGSLIQFPIKLGYSITSHKAQGLTVDCAMMDVSNSFETGQLYTALSRVRSLDDMYMKNKISMNIKTSDPEVNEFYEKVIANNGVLDPVPMDEIAEMIEREREEDKIDFSEFNL